MDWKKGLSRPLMTAATLPLPLAVVAAPLLLLDPQGCRPFDLHRRGLQVGEAIAAVDQDEERSGEEAGEPVLSESLWRH